MKPASGWDRSRSSATLIISARISGVRQAELRSLGRSLPVHLAIPLGVIGKVFGRRQEGKERVHKADELIVTAVFRRHSVMMSIEFEAGGGDGVERVLVKRFAIP